MIDTPLMLLPHPLTSQGREYSTALFLPRETLGQYVSRVGVALPKGPFRVQHNGHYVPISLWPYLIPRTGDHIIIHASAEGGSGGKIAATVAMLALTLVAPYLGGYLVTGTWTTAAALSGATAFAASAATLGVMAAGSFLISALAPAPKALDLGGGGKFDSPTYAISGGQNRARAWEPMMLIFGTHKVVPDMGAKPYAVWDGDTQYYSQIFHFGLQGGDLEGFNERIGESEITSFTGVTTAISGADGKLAGFADNVSTIDGFKAPYNQPITRTTPDKTVKIAIDVAFTVYFVQADGDKHDNTSGVTIRVRKVGSNTWTSQTITVTNSKVEVVRRTITFDGLASGAYDVEVTKQYQDKEPTPDEDNDSQPNLMSVVQIQSTLEVGTVDYTGQSRYGLKIQATDQLNGVVNEFSAIVKAKMMVWNGSSWVKQKTANPAWCFLFFARGAIDSRGLIYGCGLDDSEIDIEAIKAWAVFCDQKGLEFNYVLDRRMNQADVLDMIARAGRGSKTMQPGKLSVIWDQANLPVSGYFGPHNIRAGSFKVTYLTEDLPDEIVINFPDRDNDWKMGNVRVTVPGVTQVIRSLELDLDGCTSKIQAGKEANLLAASQVMRRKNVTFEIGLESLTAFRGDVVMVTHDLTVWGYTGRILARNGNDLKLSHRIPTGSGYMTIRDPEGNALTVSVAGDMGETDEVTIVSDLDDFALPGDSGFEDCPAVDWVWLFDPLATPGRRMKVIEVSRVDENYARYVLIDDTPEYYASENNPYIYTPPQNNQLLLGTVFDISFGEGWYNTVSGVLDTLITWSVSVPVPCDVVIRVNGSTVRELPATMTTSTTLTGLHRGDEIDVTVTPRPTAGKGTAMSKSHTVLASATYPTPPDLLVATVDGARLRLTWTRSEFADVVAYEVRDTDDSWGGSGALFSGDATSCLIAPPAASATYYVRAVNAAGLYSKTSATAAFVADVVPDIDGIEATFSDTALTNATVTLSWDDVAPQFGLAGYRWAYETKSGTIAANHVTLPADWIGNRTFTIQAVDSNGRVSAGYSQAVQKRVPDAPTDVRAQVIDNTVLLYWTLPAQTTLPIDHVRVKQGATWALAEDVGVISSSFAYVSELSSGMKTYWLACVDTDGWESTPVSVAANVGQPPDFVSHGEQVSAFDGTLTNAYVDHGRLLLPVNTTETWEDHFTTRSWAGPQDQISAGYPIYAQPTLLSGSYKETFDFGNVLASSRVTTALSGENVVGSPAVSLKVETSADGAAWTDQGNSTDVFVSNFRFVRLTVIVTQSGGTDLYQLNSLSVKLSTKLKTDAGTVSAVSTDPDGTLANFGDEFIDVAAITATPAGTTSKAVVVDYKDAVLAGTWSITSGVVTVSVTGHGQIVGQAVRLGYMERDREVLEVASVLDANTFTCATTGADGSGDVLVYSQGARYYLFDSSGARVSGDVSWTVRGS